MPEYCNLIKQIVLNVLIGILGTMLGILAGILISLLVFPILIITLNISTDNKLIIIDSVVISCILIGGIIGFIGVLYITGIIKNKKNTITNQVYLSSNSSSDSSSV